MKIEDLSDAQLEAELKKRKELKYKAEEKKRLSQPYRPGKPAVPAEKVVPCFPTCREEDMWNTSYFSTCNVCGLDWI